MKKLFVCFCYLIVFASFVNAGKVSMPQALGKAQRFMKGKTFTHPGMSFRAKTKTGSVCSNPFYVFNANEGGFVIISGDDRTKDVLGYSSTGTLNLSALPPNLEWWLKEYARQIEALQPDDVALSSSDVNPTTSAIAPLIQTEWNQGAPYNYMCPDGNGKDYYDSEYDPKNRCVTGCVATALAQVMYYWQWPSSCRPLDFYYTTTGGFLVKALPATDFNWSVMKPTYGYNEQGESANAVAKLMRYCGQSVQMDYGVGESGGFFDTDNMVNKFGYSPNIQILYRDLYSEDIWNSIICEELSEGCPVLYSGGSDDSGHAFIVDGYDGNGLYHINWGWGGAHNDEYYVLSIADPLKLGDGYRFSQNAVVGVKPYREGETEPYAVLSEDKLTMTFFYDGNMISRNGKSIVNRFSEDSFFSSASSTVTTVVFDESFSKYHPVSTAYWFHNFSNLKSIEGISNLRTERVGNMSCMFYGCSDLSELDLSGFRTDNVTDMSAMFYGCSSVTDLDVSGFETAGVTDMRYMFYNCSRLTNLVVSSFTTDYVTDMSYMFAGCSSLLSLDLSGFETANVTSMSGMFYGCSALTKLNVSELYTYNVTNMNSMFYGCSSLSRLDLSGFNTDNVTNMGYMFCNCSNLTTIYVSDSWNTELVTAGRGMFSWCTSLVGGQGTAYDRSCTDYSYAHIDGGVDFPGYFTNIADAAGIKLTTIDANNSSRIYNLNGMRLVAPQKGFNIIGDRKIMIR